MELVHYGYPSIEQFRTLLREVKNRARYVGRGDDGKAIFDPNKSLPKIKMHGSVKLHGSNCSVALDMNSNCYSQSKEIILTEELDNEGFREFFLARENWFRGQLSPYLTKDVLAVVVYGEWCGVSQKGAAVCGLPKMFVVFDIRVITTTHSEGVGWLPYSSLVDWFNPEQSIYNISMFGTWDIEVDVANPEACQNQLVELTTQVERECPVAKYFGVSGIGEGIVWTTTYNDRRYGMKVKGQKHSGTKVKVAASVDVEKLNSVDGFIAYAFTEQRLNQGIEWMGRQGLEITLPNLGHFLKWVFGDVFKEESDTLESNNLTAKDISGKGNYVIRQFYQTKLGN